MKYLLFLLLSCLYLLAPVEAYYLSGKRNTYKPGAIIKTETDKLTSIPRALPFEFYKYHGKELPFCKPDSVGGGCKLGECLSGVYRQKSAYEISANVNQTCRELADVATVKCTTHQNDYKHLKELIKYSYRAQFTLDGLPIATVTNHSYRKYELGYPIGYIKADRYYLNNHLDITIKYGKTNESDEVWIVGFAVTPWSLDFKNNETKCGDMNTTMLLSQSRLDITEKADAEGASGIVWSYGLTWELSDLDYDKRWEAYFTVNEDLHWVSLTYAIVVAIALTVFLAIVLVKIVHSSPISKFNFDDVEESGWKTLHGDVFRAPQHFMVLSVLVGTGAQLLSSAFAVLLLGAVGFLTPAQSGSLNTGIIAIYPMLGFIGGYTSARVYTRLGGGRKRRNAVMTAFGFNGCIFIVWFIAEIILWSQSSSAGSLQAFFGTFSLLLFVHVPLVFLGSFFAHKRPVGSNPVGTNTIPRMIPPAPWYSHTYLLVPLLSILPFGVSFNELFDMMDAMWSHHVYYFFGVVLVVFILLTIIIAEVSVILCYFQLANENYHWWWRAFYIPATIVGYIFLTAIFYVAITLELQTGASRLLYLMYTLIVLMVFFVFMSSIAFYACWTFVHKIYSTLHVD